MSRVKRADRNNERQVDSGGSKSGATYFFGTGIERLLVANIVRLPAILVDGGDDIIIDIV